LVLWRTNRKPLTAWIKDHLSLILTVDGLFLIAFGGWAWIRALNPAIVGTEKPMELAFINAILRSPALPPHDPWLSGYSISYYYFGYLMVAMLAKLTGTAGPVAFNLGVSLTFGLTALGSYGVIYNLTAEFYKKRRQALLPALLGPLFTLIVSNWEGFLHLLHARGFFWETGPQGRPTSAFWSWLGIKDLVNPPTGNSFGHWWWWRASRVIMDTDFVGGSREVISEFPFFSYLLGDLHPHVLAMPFALLVIGAAYGLYRGSDQGAFRWLGLVPLAVSPLYFWVLAWLTGALGFLNTWDFPIYVALISGVYTVKQLQAGEDFRLGRTLKDFLSLAVPLGLTGIMLYLPFYLSFSSQAGGVIPNALYITRGRQLWVMFGPLLIPLLIYTLSQVWAHRARVRPVRSALLIAGLFALLLTLSTGLTLSLAVLPPHGQYGSLEQVFLSSVSGDSLRAVVQEGLSRRIEFPGTWLTLAVLGIPTLALLIDLAPRDRSEVDPPRLGPGGRFVLVLITGGLLLVLAPEFVFLRDLFGYRINTIFKFYFQAWIFWSLAAAYGTLFIFRKAPFGWAAAGSLLIVGAVGLGLFYPVLALPSKTNQFQREGGATLDGSVYFETFRPEDARAADWLKEQPLGVIAEAVGGSYSSSHARMATYTGLPAVLGWDFHEIQWRGGGELVYPRKDDIAVLYCTDDWAKAEEIISRYQIRYLVVGPVERSTYTAGENLCPAGLNEGKFSRHLDLAYANPEVSIYTKE
jgi:YYY domain-containing protein